MKFRPSLWIAAFALFCSSFASAEVKPIKALLVIGGCCHDYEVQKDLIKNGLEARLNIEVDIDYSPDKTTKPEFESYKKDNWADGYDVIIHDECAAHIREAEMAKRIIAPHKAGLPAVNLHCAMHSYRVASNIREVQEPGSDGALWFEFLGLQSSSHGPKEPIEIDYQEQASPILKGLEDYTSAKDELYNVHHIYEGATVLAKGKQEKKDGKVDEAVVAWKHEYGPNKARVFGTTLGHFNEIVGSDEYLDLVARALLWTTKKLDEEGEPVEGYWIEK
ncbi:MAG: ThuA domain-containing protein [Akkermansiaceae bacterium]|nr:ThuA domain-containing protein [Akkermansiaceae bacterium]